MRKSLSRVPGMLRISSQLLAQNKRTITPKARHGRRNIFDASFPVQDTSSATAPQKEGTNRSVLPSGKEVREQANSFTALLDFHPSDVGSLEVFRGASASAIYESRPSQESRLPRSSSALEVYSTNNSTKAGICLLILLYSCN